jgi:hypothetical protein
VDVDSTTIAIGTTVGVEVLIELTLADATVKSVVLKLSKIVNMP